MGFGETKTKFNVLFNIIHDLSRLYCLLVRETL